MSSQSGVPWPLAHHFFYQQLKPMFKNSSIGHLYSGCRLITLRYEDQNKYRENVVEQGERGSSGEGGEGVDVALV